MPKTIIHWEDWYSYCYVDFMECESIYGDDKGKKQGNEE